MARKLVPNAMGLMIWVDVPDPIPVNDPASVAKDVAIREEVGDRRSGMGEIARQATPQAPPAAAPTVTPPAAAFSASQMLENLLKSALGISGLGGWAADLWNRGASATEIIQALRYGTDTSDGGKRAYEAYLQAFPRMDEFLRDGVFAGENPELQYINYRNSVREAASRYGIDATLTSNQKIADYIGNRVSAAEIVDRMNTAATAIATTPPETYAVLEDYYGITGNDLMSFYLDTDETEAMLQKRYTAARIGTEAARQEFGISATEAENLAQRGVTLDEASTAFGTAARQSTFTQGRGEIATREELMGSVFGEEEASSKVRRIAASRVGQFQQGGAFVAEQGGVSGLGTAATR